ncbi:dihydrodipicolinate synthase family protein [Kutzneria viridogrisea]|uniref:Dihydrodipicolinate synthase family protein n=2 Tax=Kutzneria TaxID=43356 RepID=W5WE70_9PSEU|nr:DUF993 family protein [Kutzneria albida]AHH96474.1 hypothetical protein KALB_3106 [Kutzneria albida DSM 43870]MBA8928308.1 hypothetical protein [Kutzneria viridogrisea]
MNRVVFAAAHVAAHSHTAVDWENTLRFRHYLWSLGLGVAEAMDTAQRGMGLDWVGAAELIHRSAKEAASVGGRIACGVGTDQLHAADSVQTVLDAYREQLDVVEDVGAQPVLMASRQLAGLAARAEDYHHVYGTLLGQVSRPAILHWLGPMFDPALSGYWGSTDLDAATAVFLDVVRANADRVDGVKISLLDADREVALRRALPAGVRCYTGDDFHYPELIAGDEHGYSDALLGVFDPLAAVAARALTASSAAEFRQVLDPTVELARHVFEAPTRYYKTGVVFLAWLAGHQDRFVLLEGLERARTREHLLRCHELAEQLDLFDDPDLAAARARTL